MFYRDLIHLCLHCNLPLMFPISIVLLSEVIIAFSVFLCSTMETNSYIPLGMNYSVCDFNWTKGTIMLYSQLLKISKLRCKMLKNRRKNSSFQLDLITRRGTLLPGKGCHSFALLYCQRYQNKTMAWRFHVAWYFSKNSRSLFLIGGCILTPGVINI